MRRVACIALADGIRVGHTVAAARAKRADLRVRVASENAVRDALIRVAEAALAFGPAVSFCEQKHVVWVEIGGCSHLHDGERGLAAALGERVRALGHACRIAIADGPRIAAAVARFSDGTSPASPGRRHVSGFAGAWSKPESQNLSGTSPAWVVPEGQGAAA